MFLTFCSINKTILLEAMKTVEHQLSDSERKRNKHGPHILYRYNHNLDYLYKSAHPAFPDIFHCHARFLISRFNPVLFQL